MATSRANKQGQIICFWVSSFMNYDLCLVNTVAAFLYIRISALISDLEENQVLLRESEKTRCLAHSDVLREMLKQRR